MHTPSPSYLARARQCTRSFVPQFSVCPAERMVPPEGDNRQAGGIPSVDGPSVGEAKALMA